MAVSVKLTDVNRYISRNYGSLNNARRQLGIRSAALTRAKIAQMIGERTGKRYATIQQSLVMKAQTRASQANLKARQGLQQKSYEQRQALANKIISDLNASSRREAVKNKNSAERTKALRLGTLAVTDVGGRIGRTITLAKINNTISRQVYTNEYKEALRSKAASLRPSKIITNNKPFGQVTVQGTTFYPQSQREANYLGNLKKTIARDQKLKKDWNDTLERTNLVVKTGDKWYVRGYKGTAQLGTGFLFIGGFLSNAGEKLVAAVAGLGASRNIRGEVGKELVRAGKETPKLVLQSLDPTKPENWANILLIAFSVNSLARAKLASNNPKIVKSNLKKVDQTINKVRSAKARAKINPVKNKSIIKKLGAQEKSLLAKKAALKNRLDLLTKKQALAAKKVKIAEAKKLQKLQKKGFKAAERANKALTSKRAIKSATRKMLKERRLASAREFKAELKLRRSLAKLRRRGVKTISPEKAKSIVKKGERAYIKNRVRETLIEDKAALARAKLSGKIKKYIGSKKDLANRRALAKTEFKNALKIAKAKGKVRRKISLARTKEAAKRAKGTAKLKLAEERLRAETPYAATKNAIIKTKYGNLYLNIRQRINIRNVSIKPRGVNALEVKSSNGQVTLIKTPKSDARVLGGQRSIIVKKPVLKEVKAYSSQVLALASKGRKVGVTQAQARTLHNRYFPLFATGSAVGLTASRLGVTPFSSIAVASKISGKTSGVSKTSSDSAVRQLGAVVSALASDNISRLKTSTVEKLLQRYKSLKDRVRRLRKPKLLKLFFPRVKRRSSKRMKLKFDELYSKVKKKYRPSLSAILFGIYGYRPKVITGFEIRPILIKRKRKK